jgi:hypothetical protein
MVTAQGFTIGITCVRFVPAQPAALNIAMSEDQLEGFYEFAERAFIRIQAGEVLSRCLDVDNISPIHKLVENLVIAGPESLDVFREVLAETNLRKSQMETDLKQVVSGLRSSLASYGFTLQGVRKASTLERLKPARFINMLKAQGISDEETQHNCVQLIRDARDLMQSLEEKYNLLAEAENYLTDWMWGVCYNTARQGLSKSH